MIMQLPPVTPNEEEMTIKYIEGYNAGFCHAQAIFQKEPKTGHWIYDDEYSDWFEVTYKCSCCKRAIIVSYEARNEVYKNYPYCHCGAKMVELQERSEE